ATVLSLQLHRRYGSPWVRARSIALAMVRPPLPRWQRIAWIVLLAWLAFRFATLAVEIASRPLYPWDAWSQWATKARVWYELRHMAPFVPGEAWLAGASGDRESTRLHSSHRTISHASLRLHLSS